MRALIKLCTITFLNIFISRLPGPSSSRVSALETATVSLFHCFRVKEKKKKGLSQIMTLLLQETII